MKNTTPRRTPDGEAAVTAYLHARANAAGVPLAGTFELTPRCNFSCRMCYIHENADPARELSAEAWIKLGRAARDAGMLFLLLTGGEPFLRRDFAEIYTALRKMGLMISINTNASLLTDKLLEVLLRYPPTRVNVSLYGGSGDTYRALCGQPAYDTVTGNILRMKNAGLQVKLNCAVTPSNAGDIEAIHDFAKTHALPIQSTCYMYPPVRVNGCRYGEAPARFTAEEAAQYTLLCREQLWTPEQLAASAYSPVEEDCARDVGDHMSCRAGRTSFWITWNGRMMPCGTFPTEGSYDVRAMGFGEAWQQVRQDTARVRMPRECAGCGLKKKCVACAAACMAESGDTTIKPEYICRMTHRLQTLMDEKYHAGGESNEAEP